MFRVEGQILSMDRRLILLISVLAVAIGVIVWWMGRSHFSPMEKRFSSGFSNRVLAMELVRTTSDVQEVVGDLGDPNREVMRDNVQKDFFFIPSYGLLFAALGWLLGRSEYRLAIWVGAAIVVCAVGAGAFDVLENLRIFRVLDARLADTTPAMVESLRAASLVKWALVFISMALLSPIVFMRQELFALPIGPPRLAFVFGVIIALAYLLAAITGMIGLKQNPLIEKASMFMSLALLLTVLLLLVTFFARSRTGSTAGI